MMTVHDWGGVQLAELTTSLLLQHNEKRIRLTCFKTHTHTNKHTHTHTKHSKALTCMIGVEIFLVALTISLVLSTHTHTHNYTHMHPKHSRA